MALIVLIFGLSYVANLMPERWSLFVRDARGFSLLMILLWTVVQVFKYRADLEAHNERMIALVRSHRDEIMTFLEARNADVEELRRTAANLAQETARIAAELAVEARAVAQAASIEVGELKAELKAQIAEGITQTEKAVDASNSTNVKIENLNERLVEQGKDAHNKLDVIEHVTKDSHEILKAQHVAELETKITAQADKATAATDLQTAKIDDLNKQILEQTIASDEKLDTIKQTTEDSHDILKTKLGEQKDKKK